METGDSSVQWKIHSKNRKFALFDDEKEKKWLGPYFFIQSADIQFGLIEGYIEKLPNPGWEKEVTLAVKSIEKINCMSPKPRFLVMCGDLCDAMPDGDQEVYKKQISTFKKIFSQLNVDIPLVCVCGNHDVGDNPTKGTLEKYRSNWGDDYFSFWCGGILYLALNSQYYCDPSRVQQEAEEQEKWLDKVLASAIPGRTVVFMHVPPFLQSADDTGLGYFALEPEPRMKLLDKLHAAGVKTVFCGHYHRNAGGFYKDMEVIVTSAMGGQLGDDLSGFRVVCVDEKSISHTYYDIESAPRNISLK